MVKRKVNNGNADFGCIMTMETIVMTTAKPTIIENKITRRPDTIAGCGDVFIWF